MRAGWEAGDYVQRPLSELLDDLSGDAPVPAAGSLAAATGALAAALTAKVARRSPTLGDDREAVAAEADRLRARLEPGVTRDAAGYAAVLAEPPAQRAETLSAASRWPKEIAAAATEVAELAAGLAERGNPNLRHDAAAAHRFATVAADVASALVRANEAAPPA